MIEADLLATNPIAHGVQILYDARWTGNHGIGRFADQIRAALPFLTPFRNPRRPWDPFDPLLLSAMLWRERPDLFFSPGYNSPSASPGPFVFTLHDLHHLRVPENSNALKRAYYEYCIRPACRRAACVLTVSEYSKCEILNWAKVPENKVVNVGNGVGFPFVETGPAYEPGYPYLLYVGSRKPHKNLSRLLKAFDMSGVGRDLRLILSGQPDESLAKLISQLGLDNRVAFISASDNQFLASVYRGAHAFLFVSFYEGFGLPPLEAMACGTPVLTSNVCSLPEVMGDAGLLVDPWNVEQIAEGIKRIVHDSPLREELQRKGSARAKQFSWEATGSRISEVLNAAVDESRVLRNRCGAV